MFSLANKVPNQIYKGLFKKQNHKKTAILEYGEKQNLRLITCQVLKMCKIGRL